MKAKILLLSVMAMAAVMFTERSGFAASNCYSVISFTEHDCACNGNTTHDVTYFVAEWLEVCGNKWIYSWGVSCPGPGGPCPINYFTSRNCSTGDCRNNWNVDADFYGAACCGGGD